MTNTNTMTKTPNPIPQDLTTLEKLDGWEIADGDLDPRGFDLMGRNDEKIGSIENLLVSPSTQQAHFAIVDTGGWFSSKRFLIPLESIDFRDDKAYGPFTRKQFEKAPEWSGKDRNYDRYYAYWSQTHENLDRPGYRSAQPAPAKTMSGNGSGEVVVPVVEESLQVGKRQVQSGGVRIRSRVIEKPVEANVRLHEEHVTVDRRPVDRAVTGTDQAAFREGTIEVMETSEQAVVAKEARVVEEVVVNKNATERTETVRDTVRRTDVDVDEDIAEETTRAGTARSGRS